jgi:cytochrome b561
MSRSVRPLSRNEAGCLQERWMPERSGSENDGAVAPPYRKSYGRLAIAIHWLTAFSVLAMVAMGWWMMELVRDPAQRADAFPLFQLHKSIGLLILAVTLFRIVWRWRRPAPPLPAHMPAWERTMAVAAQAAFYLLLLAIPFTGWIYISTQWAESMDIPFAGKTLFFGLFKVPYLGIISDSAVEIRRSLSFRVSGVHAWLAYTLLVLAAMHAAAALKHYLFDRDNVLGHMLPWLSRKETDGTPVRRHGIGLSSPMIWLAATAMTAGVALAGWTLNTPPPAMPGSAVSGSTTTR